ncbi:MAG TPA: cation-translocating P-type ATPase [Polyangiaceae bacterium]|nr:cation-translocating P-type ATPase [Polyangiaceae bacterium]
MVETSNAATETRADGRGPFPSAEEVRASLPGEDPTLSEAASVAERLGVDPERGLSAGAAAERLQQFGPNALKAAAETPAWRKLLAQFADPLVYLLLGAVVVSLAAWGFEGAHGLPFEAIVVIVIVIANGLLGYAEEARAEQAVAALQRMTATMAAVLRGGEQQRIPSSAVVPGDILILAEGDAVAADARLLSAANLQVAEASLTGESEAVFKHVAPLAAAAALGDRVNMVYKGTAVVQGAGRGVVTATAMATEMGSIAQLLAETPQDPTPLEREIGRVGRTLGLAVVAIAVVVVGAVLLTSMPSSASGVVEVLLLGVSLAVAAVPEGLPAVLSVVLAVGVQRMAKQRAIVKKLASVETLGSTTVICSDKTGTLTRNEMTIVRIVTHSGEIEVTGTGYRPEGELLASGGPLAAGSLRDEALFVLHGGSLVNDAVLAEADGQWSIQGDPTDAAFLVAEAKSGGAGKRRERFQRVADLPFSSARKLMSTLAADRDRGERLTVVVKGAPDVLLGRCTRELCGGDERPLQPERRERILAEVERLSDQALRTLAVAYRATDDRQAPDTEAKGAHEAIERDLVFAGVVGMIDPARPEATAAIAEAQSAGVRTIMITGDHPRTAARIAASLGLAPEGARAYTGLELDRLDAAGFAGVVREVNVFARVAPAHKLRIVDALQADRAVVAMTGDGVNDAPALKSADIGIAMGISGTEVTKEAAKMILADDNFATIITAVREGRLIFDNIRKFLRYLLSSNIGEVLTVLLGVVGHTLFGLRASEGGIVAPLLATQVLWINLLTDAAPALALGVDRATDNVMARPPRAPGERIIDREMRLGVLFIGVVMALATLLALDSRLPGGFIEGSGSVTEARTVAFTTLVLAQLFNCFNARSPRTSALRGLFTNWILWAAVGVSLVLQILVTTLPALNVAFDTMPLPLEDWVICTGMASAVLVAGEIEKLALRVWGRRSAKS